ncbi:SDR family NAD(P)-dependent oxidoreductase [Agrococcus jejuensis]|nr:SDR family NAD(P)-dependent oxidoreductase [Agrococcus jejuensis]
MRALVTGASSGIGAAFARALAARGHDLVLVARDRSRLEAMAAELPVDVEVLPADLSVRDEQERVAARIESEASPIGMVVTCAGFGMHAQILSEDPSEHDRAWEVMGRATQRLAAAAARTMRPRREGAIITVSSTAGLTAMGAYAAIKSWVTTMTEGLANELHGSGVTVTALLPGWVRTEFHERAGMAASGLPDVLWLEPDAVVAACLRDVDRGKVLSIPSVRYKAFAGLLRIMPRSGVRAVSRALRSRRDR